MNKCFKVFSFAFVAYDEAAEVVQPRVGALDDVAAAKASELTSILMRRLCVVASLRNDRLDVAADKQGTRGVAVIATVGERDAQVCTPGDAPHDDV